MSRQGRAWVGTSGWLYPRWRGEFYPKGLRQRDELSYLADRVTSIEVNASFYSLRRPSTYAGWRGAVPDCYPLALKGGRFITHLKRLRGVEAGLANFFASGPLALGPSLGPILWQLPERVEFDAAVVSDFLDLLPRTTTAMAALARRHDDKLSDDRVLTKPGTHRPVRHALEPRHASFDTDEARALLRDKDVAMVHADTAGRFPTMGDGTASFHYVRLHGEQRLYGGGYSEGTLASWAEQLAGWTSAGEDAYVYFDNDADGRAPYDAVRLIGLLGDRAGSG
ncbi:DUF72 domain-containing protein [Phycicoccus ginsengisoli]